MPLTKVRVGYDAEEYGTVTVDGDALAFAGPNVDAVKDHVRFHAEKLGRRARDDKELNRIKPAAVLAAMVEGDQGRLWAMEDESGDGGEEYAEADPDATTDNQFCPTGKGGGVDPSCGAGGGDAKPAGTGKFKKVNYKGGTVTIELGADGKGTIVDGPKEHLGKVLSKPAKPTPAKAASPSPPPPAPKPADSQKPSPKEFKDAGEAEAHFAAAYHTTLRKGAGADHAEYLAAAAHIAAETDRMAAAYPLAAKVIRSRKATPQTLEVGERMGTFKGSEEAGKYTAYRGIQLSSAPVDPKHAPVLGGGHHTVGTDLGTLYRHEFGHEVWETGLSRASQAAWVRMYDKSFKGSTAVSNYGGTHPGELWSESFAAYTSANYRRGSLPAEIERFMDKALGATPTTNAEWDGWAAAPTGNEWATDPATGLLVRNVFCATGPGGGTDPSCKPGRTAAQTAFLTNHPEFAPLYETEGRARYAADLALYDASPKHPDFDTAGTMAGLAHPPTDPLEKPHRVRVRLARRIHELDKGGLLNDADRGQLRTLMTALGVRTLGTRGEVTRFDPEFHALPAGVGAPTGATVRVLRPGYTGLYGSKTVGHDTTGDNWLRAEVELL